MAIGRTNAGGGATGGGATLGGFITGNATSNDLNSKRGVSIPCPSEPKAVYVARPYLTGYASNNQLYIGVAMQFEDGIAKNTIAYFAQSPDSMPITSGTPTATYANGVVRFTLEPSLWMAGMSYEYRILY